METPSAGEEFNNPLKPIFLKNLFNIIRGGVCNSKDFCLFLLSLQRGIFFFRGNRVNLYVINDSRSWEVSIICMIYSVDNARPFVDPRTFPSWPITLVQLSSCSSLTHSNNIPTYKFSPFTLPHAFSIYIILQSLNFLSWPICVNVPFFGLLPYFLFVTCLAVNLMLFLFT